MPSITRATSSSTSLRPPLLSPTKDTTIASVSSHSVDQSSSSSSEKGESDSSTDDVDDEKDDDDPLDLQTRRQMKHLLLKARQAAASQSNSQSNSKGKGKGKAVQDGDALANNDEIITFGHEQDDDESSDDDDDEEDDSGQDEPKASTSKSSLIPKSLVAPLKVNRGLNTISNKPVRADNIKPETSMRESAIVNASKSTSGKVIKGDKWGMMPMKSLSKKDIKARHPPTAGPSWFNMPAPAITPQLKREVQAMRLRNALDPKRFYRGDAAKADSKLPEFFQVGHVLNESQRPTNADPVGRVKKRSFVEELVEDEQAKAYTKRKTVEVMRKGMSGRKGKARRRKA